MGSLPSGAIFTQVYRRHVLFTVTDPRDASQMRVCSLSIPQGFSSRDGKAPKITFRLVFSGADGDRYRSRLEHRRLSPPVR